MREGVEYRDSLVINHLGQLLTGTYTGWEGSSRLGRSAKRHLRQMEGAVATAPGRRTRMWKARKVGETWCISRAETAPSQRGGGGLLRLLSPEPADS